MLFVTTNTYLGNEVEKVYEMAHIEFLPPYFKSQTDYYDFTKDGSMTFKCLNTDDNLTLINDPKYWSEGARTKLLSRTKKMWDETIISTGIFR